ncbi:phage tail sheath subtilisin-like domain-containing protein [Phenylobacterium sp.]|uniref:phage tail sheath subtilisin-like domain-containing protein n=1 Tax=Phenylobacterium sp. TaxID=1871053 RepID=UPI00301C44B0
MATYHHGLKFTESAEGARYLRERSQSILGLVGIAADADVDVFPANTPVLLTDVRGAIAKAGANGTLAASLQAVADQADPVAVVIRTTAGAGGEGQPTTEDNVVAAVELMLTAQAALGVRPRVLGAPGLDTQDVAGELAAVAAQLRGFAYASAAGDGADTVAEAVTYRGEFSARELMLLYPDARRAGVTVQAVAAAMGLRARIDQAAGWHKTISNVELRRISGVTQPLTWDFESMETDAGVLNAADVTALIHNNGYRFWGNRTCSDDPVWAFESSVRTNAAIKDMIADGIQWAADLPLHPSLVRDILEMINLKGRELIRAGRLIGFEAWYDAEDNTTAALAAGKLRLRYRFTDTPPLEDLGVVVAKTDDFFFDFAARI